MTICRILSSDLGAPDLDSQAARPPLRLHPDREFGPAVDGGHSKRCSGHPHPVEPAEVVLDGHQVILSLGIPSFTVAATPSAV